MADVANLSLAAAREEIRFCNSYSRLPALLNIWAESSITSRDWLTLLGEEWSTCDNIGAHAEGLIRFTPLGDARHDPSLRQFLMTDAEQAALDALPDTVTVYRGCYANNKHGLSWTLQEATATKFPILHRYRQPGQPLLVRARVPRDEILALKLDREEAEVIAVRPRIEAIRHIKVETRAV